MSQHVLSKQERGGREGQSEGMHGVYRQRETENK